MSISISEIVVILLIALLVIKPEQLPEVAYTLGRMGQVIKQFFSKFKVEVTELMQEVDKKSDQKRG